MQDYEGKWLSNPEMILFTVENAVATITLNRPDKRNALSPALLKEMHDAMIEADDRTDVSVIVLEGAGKDFCAGYDLAGTYAGRLADGEKPGIAISYRSKIANLDDDAWNIERQQVLTTVMFDLHKPVIAKLHGNCLAGGTDIAFHCDLIVAADEARIGFPASRANGCPPNQMWVYHMGPQWTKRLLFTGDTLSGADAAKVGLVLDSVPAAELDAYVLELATRIAAVDTEILSTHKRIVNMALEQMGAKTLQRVAAEMDARAHLATGPRRMQFKKDMVEHDLKTALKNRDAPFGDGRIILRGRRG
jgi:enoyl-CoA hydratase